MKSGNCWGKGAVLLFAVLLCTGCAKRAVGVSAADNSTANEQYVISSEEPSAAAKTEQDTVKQQETAKQESTEEPTRITEQESTARQENTTAPASTIEQETERETADTRDGEETAQESAAATETPTEMTSAVQTAPEETTPKETMPEETVSEGAAPTETASEEAAPEERAALMRQSIMQELPGIVCWGDSLTVGYGGDGESYPATLERLIQERITDGIPVVNNGVCVEPTYTIMARAGACPMYANAFDIPAECYRTLMHVNLPGGQYTNLTSFGDAGLNPVTIAGIKGILTPVYQEGEYGYVEFCRLEPGEPVHVEAMTQVYPASCDLYQGYINIFFMGENGFYTSPEDLVSQYNRMIEARGCDKYLIIGLTTGDNSNRGELSKKLAAAFGDRYIDMRVELCSRGPELIGLERKEGDWYNIQEGIVMGYLMSDDIHLNGDGYRAMGMIVYEKMEQLGYFNGVKGIIAAYN